MIFNTFKVIYDAFTSWPYAPTSLVFCGAILVAIGSFWAGNQQSNFNAELKEKNEKIIQLQQENNATLKGADLCSFFVTPNKPNAKGEYPLTVQNMSSPPLPVYDVYLVIRSHVDHPSDTPEQLAKFMYYLQNRERFEIGTVPFGIKRTNVFLKPGYYQIDIRTRYGRFTEMLRFGPFGNSIGQSYLVGDDSTATVISKHTTPEGFPKVYP